MNIIDGEMSEMRRINNCLETEIVCSNDGCVSKFLRKDLLAHKEVKISLRIRGDQLQKVRVFVMFKRVKKSEHDCAGDLKK